jgi:hypothetical protein
MLVDGDSIVNLMSYSLFKKLGGSDEELIKTNTTTSGVGGGEPIGAKGVVSVDDVFRYTKHVHYTLVWT